MNRSLRCQIVDDFLLETNLDSLKRKFRDYERLEKPKAIEELFTVDGNAVLGLTSTNRKYSSQQFCFYDFIDPSLAKLKNLYDQLMINFANSAKILQEIVDVYDSLKENTCIVNNLFSPEDQTPALEATFEAISEMHKQWVSCMRSQNRIIETEVRHFYRFEIENLKTIRELCK